MKDEVFTFRAKMFCLGEILKILKIILTGQASQHLAQDTNGVQYEHKQ